MKNESKAIDFVLMTAILVMVVFIAVKMPNTNKAKTKVDVNKQIELYVGEITSFEKLHDNAFEISNAGPGENTKERFAADYDALVYKMQYMQSQIDSLKAAR
jgi:hypothetical protein